MYFIVLFNCDILFTSFNKTNLFWSIYDKKLNFLSTFYSEFGPFKLKFNSLYNIFIIERSKTLIWCRWTFKNYPYRFKRTLHWAPSLDFSRQADCLLVDCLLDWRKKLCHFEESVHPLLLDWLAILFLYSLLFQNNTHFRYFSLTF